MCGEKLLFCFTGSVYRGSPPHVRGKVVLVGHDQPGDGITPACAGKRPYPIYGPDALRDHPRMCGEKFLYIYQTF